MSYWTAAAGIGRSHFCTLLPVLCTHRTAPATDLTWGSLNSTFAPVCVCVQHCGPYLHKCGIQKSAWTSIMRPVIALRRLCGQTQDTARHHGRAFVVQFCEP
uniref:Putative secreted protein n=1 Tax=Anopheles darlingi TaxID=43151 RepID=A0A2M4D6P3_ANODA